MNPMLLLFVGIAALLGLRWYRGNRTNMALMINAVDTLERVFSPREKTYTNIGGVIGYNLVYDLETPFRRMEGTIVTLPRQAILYLPISRWLLKREDKLLLTLYCDELRTGQGHIVEAARHRRSAVALEDQDTLQETPVDRNGRTFLLLWFNPLIRDRLGEMLQQLSLETLECLYYIGYYGTDNYVALTLDPGHPALEPALREVRDLMTSAPAR